MAWYDRFLGIDKRLEEAKTTSFDSAYQRLAGAGISFEEDLDFPSEFGTPYHGQDADLLGRPAFFQGYPREWLYQQRVQVLTRCHEAWERNPLAKTGIGVIRRFVVGQGITVSYKSPLVENILENWRYEHRDLIETWEKQLFDQLILDGELFVRVFTNRLRSQEFTDIKFIPIKPWWVWGIETDDQDYTDVQGYWIFPETGNGAPYGQQQFQVGPPTRVDASEVVHIKVNALAYELRGRSELFSILPWLRAYKEWLENRARINRFKGVMYHISAMGAGPAEISALRNAYKKPLEPNSVLITNDKQTLTEMHGSVGATDAHDDGREIKLMAAIGFNLPEYMLSEGANANRATTQSQELPVLRMFADYQDVYGGFWKRLYLRILEATLPPDYIVPEVDNEGTPTGKEIRLDEAFDITLPEILEKDPKNLAEALAIHDSLGIVSKKTLSDRVGYEYAKEQEQMDLETAAEIARQPKAPDFGAPADDTQDDGGEQQGEPANANA